MVETNAASPLKLCSPKHLHADTNTWQLVHEREFSELTNSMTDRWVETPPCTDCFSPVYTAWGATETGVSPLRWYFIDGCQNVRRTSTNATKRQTLSLNQLFKLMCFLFRILSYKAFYVLHTSSELWSRHHINLSLPTKTNMPNTAILSVPNYLFKIHQDY